jgi:hypothetical protein
LAGLILSIARWPALSQYSEPLRTLALAFEKEVLLQFAEDGGNQEQALGYHLFSWEFCWQCLEALKASGVPVSPAVQERLSLAGEFYRKIKPAADPWDFGDSDNAYVTPLFSKETEASTEWWTWFEDSSNSPALKYWWGDFPRIKRMVPKNGWEHFEKAGYAVFRSDDWFLRWDLSPLGYTTMAPHGHLDALHFSLWFKNTPIIIDPGTGAYYADKHLRNSLADWTAHNGPHISGPEFPKRRGTFLWSGQHDRPKLTSLEGNSAAGELQLPSATIKRKINFSGNGFVIEDEVISNARQNFFSNWKFGPQFELRTAPIRLNSAELLFQIELTGWTIAKGYSPETRARQIVGSNSNEVKGVPFESLASSAFRKVIAVPYLKLQSSGNSTSQFKITAG